MRAKEESRKDFFSSKMMGSAAGSVSGASGTGSGDEGEYYHNFNPIRNRGMLAPHGKTIVPASIKAVSPTPSQTKVCRCYRRHSFFFLLLLSFVGSCTCSSGRQSSMEFSFFACCIV